MLIIKYFQGKIINDGRNREQWKGGQIRKKEGKGGRQEENNL
jgi:hypothetical protein